MKNKEFEKNLLKKYGFESIENISDEKIEISEEGNEYKKIISFLNRKLNLLFVVPFIFIFSIIAIVIREILYFLKIKKRRSCSGNWCPTSARWGENSDKK